MVWLDSGKVANVIITIQNLFMFLV